MALTSKQLNERIEIYSIECACVRHIIQTRSCMYNGQPCICREHLTGVKGQVVWYIIRPIKNYVSLLSNMIIYMGF